LVIPLSPTLLCLQPYNKKTTTSPNYDGFCYKKSVK
jgi:hypothetical protein